MSQRLRQLARRLREEVAAFLGWWGGELREAGLQLTALAAPRLAMRLLLRVEPGALTLCDLRSPVTAALGTTTRSAPGQWPERLEGDARPLAGVRTSVQLAREEVLLYELTLPASLERELGQVISLRLERDLPLHREQVYVDHWVKERLRRRRQIVVHVLVARRSDVERVRELLAASGLRLARVGVADPSRGPKYVAGNLLPGSFRVRFLSVRERALAYSVCVVASLWVLLIAGQWIYERTRVGLEIERTAAKADAVRHLMHRLAADEAPARALERVAATPDAAEVLLDLTQTMPRDSWAYALTIWAPDSGEPEVVLSGFTPTATSLVDTLAKSGRFGKLRLVFATASEIGSGDRLQISSAAQPQAGLVQ